MFHQTITSTDGSVTTGTATEAHVMSLLRRALKRRHCTIEATRTGGVVVEREMWDGGRIPKRRTIALEPVTPVGNITAAVRRDLAAIDARDAYKVVVPAHLYLDRVGRIMAGVHSIPPATSQRLIDRGLLVVGDAYEGRTAWLLTETRVPVRVSLPARLAMLALDHRTHTIAPAGYVRPADAGSSSAGVQTPGGGLIYSRASPAGCRCRTWSATADGRDDARRLAREHRRRAAAEFIAALT